MEIHQETNVRETITQVYVLRLNHRRDRDKRITTHCALVGRAFGAAGMYYSGDKDVGLEIATRKVSSNWGGGFKVKYVRNPALLVNKWKSAGGVTVHLTMYGLPMNNLADKLRKEVVEKKLLVLVGASKVPISYYRTVDYNVAIGHQPHSEVAALALFLDRLFEGRELGYQFPDAKVKIVPQKAGKKLLHL